METKHETEINLVELFFYLRKRIIVIAAVVVFFAIIGFLGTALFSTPEYTASTRIYVLNRADEANVQYTDLQVSAYLLKDYQVLITGKNVTKAVINKLQLNMSPSQLASMISVTAPDNTRILQIGITDTDPQRAALIANTVREEAAVQLKQIMQVNAVTLVYEADVPTAPSSPSAGRNAILAAAIGLVVIVGILTLLHIWDDTIRTEEDAERYLGLSTLGVIPQSADLGTANKGKTSRRFWRNLKK